MTYITVGLGEEQDGSRLKSIFITSIIILQSVMLLSANDSNDQIKLGTGT